MAEKKMRVAIIFGGKSSEHDISIMSGKSIIKNIDKEKFDVKVIYIDKNGKVYRYYKDIELIDKFSLEDITAEKNLMNAIEDVDVVFPVLHGSYGEDGCVQGVFEMMNKPYVGCNVLTSSICMDKVLTKEIFKYSSIKIANFLWIKKEDNRYLVYLNSEEKFEEKSLDKICRRVESIIKIPSFIKPANAGSSIGVSKVDNFSDLEKAIEYALKFDKKVIIEDEVEGREVECGVLGGKEIIPSKVGEVISVDSFYSYHSKYESNKSQTMIPAKNLSKEIEKKIQKSAIDSFKIVDGKGLARVDFFIEKGTDEIYLNEINTMPGFTNISMYPKLFECSGIKYKDLISYLINIA